MFFFLENPSELWCQMGHGWPKAGSQQAPHCAPPLQSSPEWLTSMILAQVQVSAQLDHADVCSMQWRWTMEHHILGRNVWVWPCVCMYGQAQRVILPAPHNPDTTDESPGKAQLENMTVYSKYISGNSLPVKYHEFILLFVFVLGLLFQILTGLERTLGHWLASNLIITVNPMRATVARLWYTCEHCILFLIAQEKEAKVPCSTKGNYIYISALREDWLK